tara:strand:+ start:137695 stop:138504 length:810 start_codon:yes stop_codon:yes gene_type:complete
LQKNYFRISFFTLFLLFLLGCQQKVREDNEIFIGTISGPETELMEVAKQVAKQKFDLDITIFEFEDYAMPNIALSEGSIDANMFQHQPYLDVINAQRNLDLVSIGKMFIYPMAIYSTKHKTLADLPQKAIIGIPNDPSNEARALLLLQKAELLRLTQSDPLSVTPDKIKANPKQLKFKELMAAQLPRVLEDIDAACINTNYALAAGLSPTKDGLYYEGQDSPYVNIVVTRQADKDHEKFQQLMDALHSKEVIDKAQELFGQEVIRGWAQ